MPAGQPGGQQLQQVSKLAALQHRAEGHVYLPSTREAQEYIPAQLYRTVAGSAWLSLLGQHRLQMQALSPHQARAQFLELQRRRGARPLHPCGQPEWPQLPQHRDPRADGEVPPEGDPVGEDPAAHGQLQLPVRGDRTGGCGGPAHHAAAAGAGPGAVSCGGRARGEPAQCP
ncbi:uncharacterized protein [Physeter macrocephalus]|uniref:Uncharacterized protein isoform X2 n=1 Tax=Physeter macrocephalus TaxID=9755 RepID=A0A455ATJ5_PHYMC|nr:uncharacterized protein LOC114484883 isoform X2 [Physeter catodon]|eukprot:XP_028339882.1 uncharacterized protein LOC114484883 isoform X2 [Physeter catodon]